MNAILRDESRDIGHDITPASVKDQAINRFPKTPGTDKCGENNKSPDQRDG